MKYLLYISAFLLTEGRLYFRKGNNPIEVTWRDISAGQRASTVAANSFTDDVWIITKKRFNGGG